MSVSVEIGGSARQSYDLRESYDLNDKWGRTPPGTASMYSL